MGSVYSARVQEEILSKRAAAVKQLKKKVKSLKGLTKIKERFKGRFVLTFEQRRLRTREEIEGEIERLNGEANKVAKALAKRGLQGLIKRPNSMTFLLDKILGQKRLLKDKLTSLK